MPKNLTIFISLLFIVQANVYAASAPSSDVKKSLYDIEVVIFERFGQGNDEHWPEDPGEPDTSLAIGNLSNPAAMGEAILLGKEEQQLGAIAYTLKRKGALLHAHLRWRQAVKGRNSNTWYLIGDKRLHGLIRISKGRYLHVDTDLLLEPPTEVNRYRIQLHRRMRSGETHYIDHPKVGIIVRAERFEIQPEVIEDEIIEEPVIPSVPSNDAEPVEDPNAGSTPRALPDPT